MCYEYTLKLFKNLKPVIPIRLFLFVTDKIKKEKPKSCLRGAFGFSKK